MKYLYKDYCISDIANGGFPKVPELKTITDYQLIIKRIPCLTNIFDFLQIFNSTGLIVAVTRWYSYTDGIGSYEFEITYSMFGTYISQNNTDNYPAGSETGAFAKGSTTSWDSELHISAMDNTWHNYKDYIQDIHNFYAMKFEMPIDDGEEYYSAKDGQSVCDNFGKNVVNISDDYEK